MMENAEAINFLKTKDKNKSMQNQDDEQLNEFIEEIRHINTLAKVEHVEVKDIELKRRFEGFKIRRTMEEIGERFDEAVVYLKELVRVTDNGFKRLENKMDNLSNKIDDLSNKIDIMNNNICNRFDTVDAKYGKISKKLDEIADYLRVLALFVKKENGK